MAYMYILHCADGSFYVGSTIRDVETRLWEHNEGIGSNYTCTRLPVRLLYTEFYDRVEDALRREKQVQGWGRAKRIALITGHTEAPRRTQSQEMIREEVNAAAVRNRFT